MKDRLKEITRDCRADMHNADNYLTAVVKGKRFNNAHGDCKDSGEKVLILKNTKTGEEEIFNLASLIALAKGV